MLDGTWGFTPRPKSPTIKTPKPTRCGFSFRFGSNPRESFEKRVFVDKDDECAGRCHPLTFQGKTIVSRQHSIN